MSATLLAQLDSETIRGHWLSLVPLALGFVALWRLLPRGRASRPVVGAVLGAAALIATALVSFQPGEALLHDLLFRFFAGVAILGAVAMITNRNPVYAALWFAIVTLSTCGLLLLRSAPFLAAAMVIIYAGAIIVTFLFLIMLAQQSLRGTVYDRQARQPLLATFLAFLVLGGLLCALQTWQTPAVAGQGTTPAVASSPAVAAAPAIARPLTQRDATPVGTVRGLGRTLFGDYLYAVELAGTLLMVAAIGAIAIALRHDRRAS